MKTAAERRATRRRWQGLVEGWKRSGKSAAQFAAEQGVSRGTLSWWGWHLRASAKAKTAGGGAQRVPRLVRVEAEEPARTAASVGATTVCGWELRTRDGHVLRVHEQTNATDLRTLVSVLTRSRARPR